MPPLREYQLTHPEAWTQAHSFIGERAHGVITDTATTDSVRGDAEPPQTCSAIREGAQEHPRPSRPRRGIASPVAIRRGEGAQRKRCRAPSAPQLLAFSPGKEQAAGVWETCLAPGR